MRFLIERQPNTRRGIGIEFRYNPGYDNTTLILRLWFRDLYLYRKEAWDNE